MIIAPDHKIANYISRTCLFSWRLSGSKIIMWRQETDRYRMTGENRTYSISSVVRNMAERVTSKAAFTIITSLWTSNYSGVANYISERDQKSECIMRGRKVDRIWIAKKGENSPEGGGEKEKKSREFKIAFRSQDSRRSTSSRGKSLSAF